MGQRLAGWNHLHNWMHFLITGRCPRRWAFGVPFLLALTCLNVRAQQSTQLRVGHFPNLTHAQAVYARATGQFEKAVGIPIKWVSFNAGPSAMAGMTRPVL